MYIHVCDSITLAIYITSVSSRVRVLLLYSYILITLRLLDHGYRRIHQFSSQRADFLRQDSNHSPKNFELGAHSNLSEEALIGARGARTAGRM
jgi:hypothetical protein